MSTRNLAMAARNGLNLLVIDDHPLVRAGIRMALSRMEEVTRVQEAESVPAGIEACRLLPGPDLVLLDLTLHGFTGLGALDHFRLNCPDAPVVIVSASCDSVTVQAALRRGALGFVPKLAGQEALAGALRFVIGGGTFVPREALDARAGLPPIEPVPQGLTARQTDVLRLLMDGKSNKQICRDMNLALGTVKGHVAAILNALNVSSRAQAIAALGRAGWRP